MIKVPEEEKTREVSVSSVAENRPNDAISDEKSRWSTPSIAKEETFSTYSLGCKDVRKKCSVIAKKRS